MNVAQRVRIGVYLVSQAQRAWGTDRFWDVIGWWHTEVHYTIPRIEEEKRIELAMNQSFTTGTGQRMILSTGSYGVNPGLIYDGIALGLGVPGQVGYWDWNGIRLGANKSPNPLRQALVGFLLGAKWVDEEPKNRAKPGPEYLRLKEFLSIN